MAYSYATRLGQAETSEVRQAKRGPREAALQRALQEANQQRIIYEQALNIMRQNPPREDLAEAARQAETKYFAAIREAGVLTELLKIDAEATAQEAAADARQAEAQRQAAAMRRAEAQVYSVAPELIEEVTKVPSPKMLRMPSLFPTSFFATILSNPWVWAGVGALVAVIAATTQSPTPRRRSTERKSRKGVM